MAFKFCPECGFKLDREYKFCPECGYNLKSNEQTVQPQAEIMPKSKADNYDFNIESSFDKQISAKENKEKAYQAKLSKADAYISKYKYAEAEKVYESLIDDDPLDFNAHLGILRVHSSNFTKHPPIFVDVEEALATIYDKDSMKAKKDVEVILDLFDEKQLKKSGELQKYLLEIKIIEIKVEKRRKEKEIQKRLDHKKKILDKLDNEEVRTNVPIYFKMLQDEYDAIKAEFNKLNKEYSKFYELKEQFELIADRYRGDTLCKKCIEFSDLINKAHQEILDKEEKERLAIEAAEEAKKKLKPKKSEKQKEYEAKLKKEKQENRENGFKKIDKQERKNILKRLETAILTGQNFVVSKPRITRTDNTITFGKYRGSDVVVEWNICFENENAIYMMAKKPFVETTYFSSQNTKNGKGIEFALKEFSWIYSNDEKGILRGEKMVSENKFSTANVIRLISESEVNLWKSKMPNSSGFWIETEEGVLQSGSANDKVKKFANNQIVESLFYTAGTAYIYPFIVIDKQKLANIANK